MAWIGCYVWKHGESYGSVRAMTPALCLTFDDLHVANWVAARPVLDEFGARVTFCVSHIHTADEAQIAGLRMLQDDGHEIAFHSRTHPRLVTYLAEYGLDGWLENEIDRGIYEHRALGFPATSFASPFHSSTAQTRVECARRFLVTRASGPLGARPESFEDRIYTNPKPDRSVDCVGFCDMQLGVFPGWEYQRILLDTIAEEGGTGVFAGHDIRENRDGKGYYSTWRQLRKLMGMAAERGIGYRTLSQIAT